MGTPDTLARLAAEWSAGSLQIESVVRHGQRPLIHGFQNRTKAHSQWREFIDNPGRYLGVRRPCNQLVCFELPEPAGQRVGTYRGKALEQFIEATRPLEEVPYYQGGPGAIQQAQKPGNAALLQGAVVELHNSSLVPLLQLM